MTDQIAKANGLIMRILKREIKIFRLKFAVYKVRYHQIKRINIICKIISQRGNKKMLELKILKKIICKKTK
jgi:hypothetical protein